MERCLTFPAWCMETYGHKLYRIALDAGMTCPNRDGTLDTRGCIFCDAGGSGDFATKYDGQALHPSEISWLYHPDGKPGMFIGYFQAYTNTYAPVERLKQLFTAALEDPLLAGISIATRPDCLGKPVMDLLKELKQKYENKFIWVELGLQTMHEKTAEWIRRGYRLSVFEQAVRDLNDADIPVIVHVILGLPGETESMMYETIQYLDQMNIAGIKLQLLHVLEGTDLAVLYRQGKFNVLSEEEYVKIVAGCIARLRPDIVIHRMTGDGSKTLLIAPLWSIHKRRVLNEIFHELKQESIVQGCLYSKKE